MVLAGDDMAAKRRTRRGTAIPGAGATKDGRRQPDASPDASINFDHYRAVAQKTEAAELDFVFIVDGVLPRQDAGGRPPPDALLKPE
jgi:hypothetical protein